MPITQMNLPAVRALHGEVEAALKTVAEQAWRASSKELLVVYKRMHTLAEFNDASRDEAAALKAYGATQRSLERFLAQGAADA